MKTSLSFHQGKILQYHNFNQKYFLSQFYNSSCFCSLLPVGPENRICIAKLPLVWKDPNETLIGGRICVCVKKSVMIGKYRCEAEDTIEVCEDQIRINGKKDTIVDDINNVIGEELPYNFLVRCLHNQKAFKHFLNNSTICGQYSNTLTSDDRKELLKTARKRGKNQISESLEEMGVYVDSSDEEPCPKRLKTHESESV